jgi:DNA-binding NarL/FixJ family response regulator
MEMALAALDVLGRLAPSPELGMAMSNLGQIYLLENRSHEALAWGTRALELADRLAVTELRIHALNNVGAARIAVGDANGWAELEESLTLSLAANMHEHACRAYTNLSWAAMVAHQQERAEGYFDDGLRYASECDLDSWIDYMRGALARLRLEQGRWSEATDHAEPVLRSSRAAVQRITPLIVLGLVRLRRGDPGSDELLEEAGALALQTGAPMRTGPAQAALAEAAWLRDDQHGLRKAAELGYASACDKDDRAVAAQMAFWLRLGGGSLDTAAAFEGPYALLLADDWRGAAQQWQAAGCPYEAALSLQFGDETARIEALAIFDALGATRVSARLRRQLREDGVRRIPRGVRAATRQNPAGLTAREIEVLGLIAQGLSNRDIAARLLISVKTVDHHVSAVLGKLEIDRRDLVEEAAAKLGVSFKNRESNAPK